MFKIVQRFMTAQWFMTMRIFFQFFRRDTYRYRRQMRRYLTNFGMLRPILFSISFAYLQANVIFGGVQKELCTFFFIGNAMLIIMVLTFSLSGRLLFDLMGARFVEYQITILSPRLLFLQRILFSTLFTFCIMLPFFPVSKLILRSYLVTTHASWLSVGVMLLAGALCMSAYNTMWACILKDVNRIVSLWMRLNVPLLVLGGMWAPLYVIKSFLPWGGFILYLNPIMYITEGLRRAILADTKFLPIWVCVIGLLTLATVFLLISFYMFKRRVDHV